MTENDAFALSKEIGAITIDKQTEVVLPPGTVVTVVVVFGDPASPTAYEVEAFLPERNGYALATVETSDFR